MKLKKFLIAIFISVGIVSCEDAYRIDPADEIIDLNAIRNINDLEER